MVILSIAPLDLIRLDFSKVALVNFLLKFIAKPKFINLISKQIHQKTNYNLFHMTASHFNSCFTSIMTYF